MDSEKRGGRRYAADGPSAPLAYSITKLCALTDVGRSLIYQHVKSGLLRTTKVGRRTIVLRADAEAWLQHLRDPK